jgi:hypothetical protein
VTTGNSLPVADISVWMISLIQQGILYSPSYDYETSNILEETICLQDRYVRYLLGDNNFYNNSLSFIRRDHGLVNLEQVIVPEEIKEELLSRMNSFFTSREKREAVKLDEFFGYGTALTMLFYGPSGTGKTMMAQALSRHFKRPLFSIKWEILKKGYGTLMKSSSTCFGKPL